MGFLSSTLEPIAELTSNWTLFASLPRAGHRGTKWDASVLLSYGTLSTRTRHIELAFRLIGIHETMTPLFNFPMGKTNDTQSPIALLRVGLVRLGQWMGYYSVYQAPVGVCESRPRSVPLEGRKESLDVLDNCFLLL